MPRATSQSAAEASAAPRIDDVVPAAALPGGEIELTGANLGPFGPALPTVLVDGLPAQVLMSRPSRLDFRVPEEATTGMVTVSNSIGASNAAPLRVARQLSDGLHPVTNPVVSRSGMIYATISGQRGKQTPVSVVRVSPDGRGTPFRHRNSQRHRHGLLARRRSLRHLARRGQRLPHRRGRRAHRLR